MVTHAEMAFELYMRWRKEAAEKFTEDQLPTVDQLKEVALNTALLRKENAAPIVNVWGKPLTMIRALVDTGNVRGFDNLPAKLMYTPVLINGAWPASVSTPPPPASGAKPQQPAPKPAPKVEPKPAPKVEPKPVPAPKPKPSPLRDYEYSDFARVDLFADPEAVGAVTTLQREDGIRIEWTAPDPKPGEVQLFRVISDEEPFDYDPEIGEQRAVSVAHNWLDEAPLSGAVRMYQIWMHSGTSELFALKSEPVLIGEDYVIQPVEDFQLSVVGGVIYGQWSAKEGTERVAVYCATEHDRVIHKPSNEIERSKPNLRGFQFTPNQRGMTYKFQVRRLVKLPNGSATSRPSAVQSIYVPAELTQVTIDVASGTTGEGAYFDVSWENPGAGQVRLYRTENAPDDGMVGRTLESDQLEGFGLSTHDWVNSLDLGVSPCRVTWPQDWYTIYLTPVCVVGDKCMVGESYSEVRVGTVTNAFIRERVVNQLVTFGWPRNAHEVRAELQIGDQIEGLDVIDAETYRAEGGMRLELNAPGDILLVPSAHHNGKRIEGKKVRLHYRGVIRLEYEIYLADGRVFLGIKSGLPQNEHFSFTLRMLHGRLPLESSEGIEVKARVSEREDPGTPFVQGLHSPGFPSPEHSQYWQIDPELLNYGRGGFIRLFTDEQFDSLGRGIALLDPDVEHLRVDNIINSLRGQGR